MSDLIDRQKAIDAIEDYAENANRSYKYDEEFGLLKAREILIEAQPVQLEIILCKDCKYWKDSDGAYRRGFDAESKCPINLEEVYEGTFYCGMAERRE